MTPVNWFAAAHVTVGSMGCVTMVTWRGADLSSTNSRGRRHLGFRVLRLGCRRPQLHGATAWSGWCGILKLMMSSKPGLPWALVNSMIKTLFAVAEPMTDELDDKEDPDGDSFR